MTKAHAVTASKNIASLVGRGCFHAEECTPTQRKSTHEKECSKNISDQSYIAPAQQELPAKKKI